MLKVALIPAAGLGRDRRASAMVEFALITPLILTIWAGMVELAHAVDAWRKLTLLSRTVADLTAQGQVTNPIPSTLMTDILASSALVMRPFDTSKVKIVVSAMGTVVAKSATQPMVCSSLANSNGTARSSGTLASDLTIPPGYGTNGMRYVVAEVSMPYTPILGSTLIKLINGFSSSLSFSASFPWPARGGVAYAPNTYKEVILPISPASNQKACDGTSTP